MTQGPRSRRRFLQGSAAAVGAAALAGPGQARQDADGLPQVDKPGRTPNTVFAVNQEMWFGGPMEQRIAKAAELGFPAVEFWPHDGKDIDAMAKQLEGHGMTATQFTAWGFGRELNHPDMPADNFVKAIDKSCEVAARLPGCEMFTVVAGNNIKGYSKEQMLAATAAKIKQAVPVLEKHQKMIIVEPMNPYNHGGHCLYGSKDGIDLCKAVGSEHVKLNWDLFHMQRFEGNLIDNMKKGKDYIGYLQLADSPARNEPGTGEVNYTKVFQAIKEIGYTLPVGLECSPQGGDVVRAARRIYAADSW